MLGQSSVQTTIHKKIKSEENELCKYMWYNSIISRLRINHLIQSLTPGSGIADDDDEVSLVLCFACAVQQQSNNPPSRFWGAWKASHMVQQPTGFMSSQQSQHDSATASFQFVFVRKNNTVYSIISNYMP